MSQVPAPGEVVVARGGYWAVSEVQTQGLPRSSADEKGGIQHLVTLTSLAEGRLEEQLRVVWELESGTAIRTDHGLPAVRAGEFDSPETFGAFLDALRWGAITTSDSRIMQAPFRSGANVEAYQLEPVRRALSSSRTNLLLADDVGLGKTIEAGLVIQELLLRHRARTVCVVAPAFLVNKWEQELREKFGLSFRIINSDSIREIRRTHGVHVNPFSYFPRIIVSMDWLAMEKPQNHLSEIYDRVDRDPSHLARAYDILVVDEAHHIAPASPKLTSDGRKGYATDSQRTRAVRELANRCEHRLFLTATPHNGYTESFTALLEMIDNRRFARGAQFDKEALEEIVVRRLKSTLTEANIKSFPARRVLELEFKPSEEERSMYETLESFLQEQKKAKSKDTAFEIPALLLKKRFLSSPIAFAYTLNTLLSNPSIVDEDDFDYDDILGENSDDMEEGLEDQTELQTLQKTAQKEQQLTKEQKRQLKLLADWGYSYQGRPDSRLQSLLNFIESVIKNDDGLINDERIVIFSEYVATLDWMKDILISHGYGEYLKMIIGSTPVDERELIKEAFQSDPKKHPIRILLASDAAGEGVDFQNYCFRLVNYDIPFNPNKIEQRAGRIDRYGQTKSPEIYHFTVNSTEGLGFPGDYELMSRIAKKVNTMQDDLGEINRIIGDAISAQLFNGKTGDLETRKTRQKKDSNLITQVMKGDRDVRNELTNLQENLEESIDRLHVRPENLERVVRVALQLRHEPKLQSVTGLSMPAFHIPKLSTQWHAATAGLATRLNPKKERMISFHADAIMKPEEYVYIHMGHPLVQRSAGILRSSIWSSNTDIKRVTAVKIPELEESIVAAVVRLVLVGKGGLRLHEEVFLCGVRLHGRELGLERSESILENYLDLPSIEFADQAVIDDFITDWNSEKENSLQQRLQKAINARVQSKIAEIEKQLEKRKVTEIHRVNEIFSRFEILLRQSLKDASEQLQESESMLFSDVEKNQFVSDMEKWRQRLVTLSRERQNELDAIEKRYEDIRPHEFAAALIFASGSKR